MAKKTVPTKKSVSAIKGKKPAVKARVPKKVDAAPAKTKKAATKKPTSVGIKTVLKTAKKKPVEKKVRPVAVKHSSRTKGIIVEKPVIPVASIVKPIVRKSVKAPEPVVNPKKIAAENKKRFAKEDLNEFKIALLHKREQLLGLAVNMRKDALERHDEDNIEEDGTDSFSRLQTLGQAESQSQQIKAIDEALHAIASARYGVCGECGNLISKPRLLAVPFATICIGCAQVKEVSRKRRFF